MPNSNNTQNRSNRDSVADLEAELYDLFDSHHSSFQDGNGEPRVPAESVADVIRTFGEHHNGMQLLSEVEESQLTLFVEQNPGLEVTPNILLGFLRALTQASAATIGDGSGGSNSGSGSDEEVDGMLDQTFHSEGDDGDRSRPSSRSSSVGRTRGMSASTGSLPPKTPNSGTFPEISSPFDSSRRQRTAPLTHAGAPSSWNTKKLPTHGRRKSDASASGRAMSDSESISAIATPSRHRAGRHRAPSNPGSTRGSDNEDWESPPGRPSSRRNSRGNYGSISAGRHSLDGLMPMSPEERPPRPGHRRRPSQTVVERSPRANSPESDSESDGEDATLAFIRNRNDSMVSMESVEREEALQRANQELSHRVVEQDRILQRKISEHEAELEQLEMALEETKQELSSSKREEKELRGKETKYIQQIQNLESDVAKSQRALETAKTAYQSLQKQYQEQCAESENLRKTLRTKDDQVRDSNEKIALHGIEVDKWQQQHDQMERFVQSLESQLQIANEAQAQLDEQKQENMLLKETIDRMRFDMDELRLKADGNIPSESKGRVSNQGSLSKSLGQEFARIGGKWPGGENSSDEEDESTAVSDGGSGDGTEGEDVVQTIITRRKKKVPSRAMRVETIKYEDTRTYSDAYTQHDNSGFLVSHHTQTEPEPKRPMASSSMQTQQTPFASCSMQTERPPSPLPVARTEMEIQTDDNETLVADESFSPHGKGRVISRDNPPSYAESSQAVDGDDDTISGSFNAVQKWHRGLDMPLSPVAGGISEDALEEWAALKREMGFECLAIEKVIEMSLKTGRPRSSDASTSSCTSSSTPSRKSKFYNIYNTFVSDRNRDQTERDRSLAAGLTQAAVVLGACVLAAGVLSAAPSINSQYDAYGVPGGPSYYDRAAWNEFNRLYPMGEGVVVSGAASVWDVLGRITGGAARMARGWPT